MKMFRDLTSVAGFEHSKLYLVTPIALQIMEEARGNRKWGVPFLSFAPSSLCSLA